MMNRQKDILFDNLISEFPVERQATLKLMYQKASIIDAENHRREMEQMKKEIVKEVLEQIAVEIDSGDALKEIDFIREAIKRLGE
ncbi:MAG: hypothetical protein IKM61_03700 [Eubacteriaceae bacterium]|nr:hypothetical protein [Eubacteriaceae bacterium]